MIAEPLYILSIPIFLFITIVLFVIDPRSLMKLILVVIICLNPINLSIGAVNVRIWMVFTVIYLLRVLFSSQKIRLRRAGPYILSLFLVVITATISRIVNNTSLTVILRELVLFSLTLFLFVAVINVGRDHFPSLLRVVLIAAAASTVAGILQAALHGHPNFIDFFPPSVIIADYSEIVLSGRAFGLTLNNILFAMQILTLLPLIFVARRQQWFFYVLFSLGMLLSLTRSAIALFCFGSIVIFTRIYGARKALVLFALILLAGLGLWFGGLQSIERADRLLTIMDVNTMHKLQAQLIALRVTREQALLFGFGEAQLEVLRTYHTAPLFGHKTLKHIGIHNPHNIFISSLLQYGLLVVLMGVFSYIVLFRTLAHLSAETGKKAVYFLFMLTILLPILNALIHSWDLSQFTEWNAITYSLPFAYYAWKQKRRTETNDGSDRIGHPLRVQQGEIPQESRGQHPSANMG